VPICFERSLADLQCGYLDLYLIHFPISLKYIPFDKVYPPTWPKNMDNWKEGMDEDPVPIFETWKAMEDLHDGGKVKNIGVSNFSVSLLRDVFSYARVKPAVNQVEIHPFNTQEVLVKFCK
jgi:diketogulonate reductase-like aldo/keto reductase